MKIRRFEAENANSALAMVKKEMGPTAVILATRTLNGRNGSKDTTLLPGIGKFGRPRVEVVAAMDYDLDDLTNSLEQPSPSVEPPAQKTKSRAAMAVPTKKITGQRAANQEANLRFSNILSKQAEPAARAVSRRAFDSVPHRPNPDQVDRWRKTIIDKIQVSPIEPTNEAGPTAIALVGATGVGKTTTIAKLAAWFTLRERKKVALISMDCYRIGATDQLRTYGRIMHIPCEIALNHDDLREAVARHREKDIILIDTAGKSPYDRSYVSELEEWFDSCKIIKPYLVLSATSQKENLAKVLKSYGQLNIHGLVLTKLDETQSYAALCRELAASKLPVAGLCTGQRVPEDFHMASTSFLKKLFGLGWSSLPEELNISAKGGLA